MILPIYHYSYEKYYKRHDAYVAKNKREGEKCWGVPFEQLSESSKRIWENLWWWPPWKFNDIVGFVEIGMDIGDCLTADIFMKRKYLPKNDPSRRSGNSKKTHDHLYYIEISRVPVRGTENDSYVEALKKIIRETKRVIRKRNKYFQLFIPSYEMNCMGFARAHKQLRDKARGE